MAFKDIIEYPLRALANPNVTQGGKGNVGEFLYGFTPSGNSALKQQREVGTSGAKAQIAQNRALQGVAEGETQTQDYYKSHPMDLNLAPGLSIKINHPSMVPHAQALANYFHTGSETDVNRARVPVEQATASRLQSETEGQNLANSGTRDTRTWLQGTHQTPPPTLEGLNAYLNMEKNPAEINSLNAGAEHARASAGATVGGEGRAQQMFNESNVPTHIEGYPDQVNLRQAQTIQGLRQGQTQMNMENATALSHLLSASFGLNQGQPNPLLDAAAKSNPIAQEYIRQMGSRPSPAKTVDAMTRRKGFGQEGGTQQVSGPPPPPVRTPEETERNFDVMLGFNAFTTPESSSEPPMGGLSPMEYTKPKPQFRPVPTRPPAQTYEGSFSQMAKKYGFPVYEKENFAERIFGSGEKQLANQVLDLPEEAKRQLYQWYNHNPNFTIPQAREMIRQLQQQQNR